jgi:ferredoxin
MPHVQNGTKNPPFVCEDVARCEFCLMPSALGCEHQAMGDDEIAELRCFWQAHAPKRLRCQCHPDCARHY